MRYSDRCKQNKDSGYSLVELIVVIAIMAIMVGVMSIGISLMFSRDAEAVAKTIDDELSEARMLAMSRDGEFELVLHLDSSNPANNNIVINKDSSLYKSVTMKKRATLNVSGGGLASPITSGDVKIVFDKGNGSVKTINGGTASGVCLIEATAARLTTKKSTVSLVAATGRHYVGK